MNSFPFSVSLSKKNCFSELGEDNDDISKIHNAKKVADHYSARKNQTLQEREASPIIHVKKLNNWIKSVLIQLYAKRGDAVLDMACGKGGDLIKWEKAKIGYYVGIDIAQGSIEDCLPPQTIMERQTITGIAKNVETAISLRCITHGLVRHVRWRMYRLYYDQEASSSPDANVIVHNLTQAKELEFGNSLYWIRFDEKFENKKFKASSPFGIKYKFHLEDAVDCPEWIVPFFKSLAEEYDLEFVFVKNSHAFVEEYSKRPDYLELMTALGDDGTLSPDEWEVAYLYCSFVFIKRGQPDQSRGNSRGDKGKTYLSKDDILYINQQLVFVNMGPGV